MAFNPIRIFVLIVFCCLLTGCALSRQVIPPSDFLIATVEPGDTFSTIALRYLKDPSQGWLIEEFNRTDSLTPGQTLLIPLYPYRMGGIEKNGYQVVPILTYQWSDVRDEAARQQKIERFRSQMTYLREADYSVISLPQLLSFLEFRSLLPRRSVVITFDDPKAGFFDTAYPVLRQFGYPVAIFVRTEGVGTQGRLSWDQLLELAANGMDIQSLGRSRQTLSKPGNGESFERYLTALEQELVRSRLTIEERIGRPCRFLAYPSGSAEPLTAAYAEKAGYQAAFTLKDEPTPFFADRFRLGRTIVAPSESIESFGQQLRVFRKSPLK